MYFGLGPRQLLVDYKQGEVFPILWQFSNFLKKTGKLQSEHSEMQRGLLYDIKGIQYVYYMISKVYCILYDIKGILYVYYIISKVYCI